MEDWDLPLPKDLIGAFREPESIEDRLTHLYRREIVEDRARDFFLNGPGKDEKIVSITLVPEFSHLGPESSVRYLAQLEDGPPRLINLMIPPEANPSIDFDFYSRYCDPSLSELLDGEALSSRESRVVLEQDHYYDGEFTDDEIWQSFRARSPDMDHSIMVYLKRDSPWFDRTNEVVSKRRVHANLQLKTSPKSKETKQFEILQINALNWRTLKPDNAQ
ncbi:MAG: hypothetical protein ACON38_06225 [Akkermansiaceae bacterium]